MQVLEDPRVHLNIVKATTWEKAVDSFFAITSVAIALGVIAAIVIYNRNKRRSTTSGVGGGAGGKDIGEKHAQE